MNLTSHIYLKTKNIELINTKKTCFLGHPLLNSEDRNYFNKLTNPNINSFCDIVKNINGFFAILSQGKDYLLAAVDHIRSIPLFYALDKNTLYLSDDAEWIRIKIGEHSIDPLATEMFLLAGYVPGRETLYPKIKQLQAGEALIYSKNGLQAQQYWSFVHKKNTVHYNLNELLTHLNDVSINSIQRLINVANGRQLVVPLSGGYDSRLIISLLKELNYSNVLCFSYGNLEHKESLYSKRIAESLEFPWIFIEYTPEIWGKEWFSKEALEYKRKAGNHVSLPHLQDWIAIKHLHDNQLIDSKSIIIPGHCCVTGYIPKSILDINFKEKNAINNIIETHFKSSSTKDNNIVSRQYLKNYIHDYLNSDQNKSIDFYASKIMEFNWKERQAKYITNSIRAYEQFGYDWWLPLWDKEFVHFWENVPLNYRVDRTLYKEYVTQAFKRNDKNNLYFLQGNANDDGYSIKLIKSIIKKTIPNKLKEYMLLKRKVKTNLKHPLGFASFVNHSDLEAHLKKGGDIIGYYAKTHINNLYRKTISHNDNI